MKRKLITKKDSVILALIVLLSVLCLAIFGLSKQDGETAVVSVNGQTVKEINLREIKDEQLFTLENGVVIKAQNGTVCFFESNCKDKICINSGLLSKKGDVAACVPNKTVISIKGVPEDFDVLTY